MPKNKTSHIRLFAVIAFLLAAISLPACVRQVSTEATPTMKGTNLLEELLTATLITIEDKTQPAAEEETPTNTLEEAPAETETPALTNTLHIITPTLSPAPTETASETSAGEETPAATNTPQVQPTSELPQINPDQEFTGAKHIDTLEQPELWYDASGNLPDSEYLKLTIEDGTMIVTGKRRLWDTWWISGFSLNNFYIEMDVNSEDCNSDDAYGMILRASQHGEPTHGYLIAFTCDGKVFAKRLETVSPYSAVSILNPTETDLIYSGKNQTNIFGVLMDGNAITIYPNRRYFTTIQDDAFSFGRYGIFVQAGDAGNFTYTIYEIRTWGTGD